MRNIDEIAYTHSIMYFNILFNNENDEFLKRYISKWNEVSKFLIDSLFLQLDDYVKSEEGKCLNEARKYEATRWNIPYVSVEENVEYAKDWIIKRTVFLNNHINRTEMAIKTMKSNIFTIHKVENIYDLTGRKCILGTKRNILSVDIFVVTYFG